MDNPEKTGNFRFTRQMRRGKKKQTKKKPQKTKKMSNNKMLDITIRKRTRKHNKA